MSRSSHIRTGLAAASYGRVAKFHHDVIATLGHTPSRPLALAVSGGPDSMAMLALAAAAFPNRVIAATVDHRLRQGSAGEAAMVAGHCRTIGIPHTTLIPDPDWRPKTIQADARQVRYALLGDWAIGVGAAALLTAHHADDQAETFLMRAARGSGVAGLGGIRARWWWQRERWASGHVSTGEHHGVMVIRPLLGWRRSDLVDVIAATATPFATDPSNADDRFDRVRMRALLARHPDIDAVQIAHAAAACAEADAAIAKLTDLLLRERLCKTDGGERMYDVAGLPRELRRRLARHAIACVRDVQGITEGRWSDAINVESLLDALAAGGRATLAGVLASALGDLWTFTAAPPRRSH